MTLHAIRRAEERYGIVLSSADMREIVRLCRSGKYPPVPLASQSATCYAVTWKEQVIYPVIEDGTQNCVTMLPRDFFTKSGRARLMNERTARNGNGKKRRRHYKNAIGRRPDREGSEAYE